MFLNVGLVFSLLLGTIIYPTAKFIKRAFSEIKKKIHTSMVR